MIKRYGFTDIYAADAAASDIFLELKKKGLIITFTDTEGPAHQIYHAYTPDTHPRIPDNDIMRFEYNGTNPKNAYIRADFGTSSQRSIYEAIVKQAVKDHGGEQAIEKGGKF